MSKQLAKGNKEEPKNTNLALPLADFAADAGKGIEQADRDSVAIPMLMILQSNSPQCDRTQPEYVKGAQSGDYFLNTTQELFKEEGVNVVLCYFDRHFLKWMPRNEGGGFRGSLTTAQYARDVADGKITRQTDDKGREVEMTQEGEVVRDTRVHYVMVVRADGSYTPAVFSLSSTQIKKSKMWLAQIDQFRADGPNGKFQPPSFAHVFNLTAVGESNDQGSWSGVKVSRVGYVMTAELYAACKKFHEAMRDSAPPVQAPSETPAAGF